MSLSQFNYIVFLLFLNTLYILNSTLIYIYIQYHFQNCTLLCDYSHMHYLVFYNICHILIIQEDKIEEKEI